MHYAQRDSNDSEWFEKTEEHCAQRDSNDSECGRLPAKIISRNSRITKNALCSTTLYLLGVPEAAHIFRLLLFERQFTGVGQQGIFGDQIGAEIRRFFAALKNLQKLVADGGKMLFMAGS